MYHYFLVENSVKILGSDINIKEIGKTVFWIALTTGILRGFILDVRFIPSASMEPTIALGDRVLGLQVNRVPEWKPQRDEIIVFNLPYGWKTQTDVPTRLNTEVFVCGKPNAKLSDDHTGAFIKRVIGIPGDRLQFFKDGSLKRNGVFLNPSFIKGKTFYPNIETIKNGELDFVIKDENYFVMGDNRGDSCDSRFWGTVPRSLLVSKPSIRFWPLNRIGFLN
jgi:signal peptidase I